VTPLLLPLVLLAVLALSACGGSKGTTASSSACPSGAVEVVMKDIKFAPEAAKVKVGQTVCWTNEDDVQHDAVADNGSFESSLFGHGKTFAWKATKAGVISYVCSVHPGMTGKLDVAP
jgi:plastocyanin